MTMDEPFVLYPQPWYPPASPHAFRMSRDQSFSYEDNNREFHASSNTPSRDPGTDNIQGISGVNDELGSPPPYYPPNQYHYYGSSFDAEPPSMGMAPPGGLGQELAASMPPQEHFPYSPYIPQQDRRAYETDTSPHPQPSPTRQDPFVLSLSRSGSPGLDDVAHARKKFRADESEPIGPPQEYPQVATADAIFQHAPPPMPADPSSRPPEPHDTSVAGFAYGNQLAYYPHAPAVYTFHDGALAEAHHPASPIHGHSGMDSKPPARVTAPRPAAPPPVRPAAARKPAAAKSTTTSRSKRRGTKRKHSLKESTSSSSSSPGESTSEASLRFEPTEEELQEAGSGRAREALKTWYERYHQLYEYKQKHGNCNVPQQYPANRSLGTWVNKQRMEYKALEERGKSSLTNQKLEALRNINFEWGKRKGDASWEQKFQELLAML